MKSKSSQMDLGNLFLILTPGYQGDGNETNVSANNEQEYNKRNIF
jgi:hypothetical protein